MRHEGDHNGAMTKSLARVRILHLSDTHLVAGDERHGGVVDATAALDRVLARAAAIDGIDAVVCSGDLSDDGTEASYAKLQEAIEPFAAARGAAVVYAMGNHDERAGFTTVLGPTHGARTIGGLTFIHLDSSVPGKGYGRLDAGQTDFLRAELAAADAPAVVVFHHPPVPAFSPLLAALELHRPDDIIDICAGGDVAAILAGHFHHAHAATVAGIPVYVAPAVVNTAEAFPPDGHERARVGSGFAVVDLVPHGGGYDTARTAITAAGPDDGDLVFDLDAARIAAIASAAGPEG